MKTSVKKRKSKACHEADKILKHAISREKRARAAHAKCADLSVEGRFRQRMQKKDAMCGDLWETYMVANHATHLAAKRARKSCGTGTVRTTLHGRPASHDHASPLAGYPRRKRRSKRR